MRIGGPFDTIKGPTVFLEISICICVRLTFPFNITNNTCHLKMHHFNKKKTWKTGSDLLHLQANLDLRHLPNIAYRVGFIYALIDVSLVKEL